ncbi:MAG: hypothetical protein A2Y38_16865 [Spirochaetes bacterium GWB1_59_5]|nr:MAG: hypothetical protein A2Y38_16865 [Spirochaetes bacterium GWB1_59_5]
MKRIVLAVTLCTAALAAPRAMDIDGASGRFGVAIINNQSGLGAVSPVVNTLGGSMLVSFKKGFFLGLEPGLDLYWTNYEYKEFRAVPTETERGAGNNAFVLGFILDIPLTATFRFSERIGAVASLGPSFVLRAPFANDDTAGSEDEMAANLASISSYLWSSGRWFYPSASLRLHVFLQQNFTFAFGVRGSLPVFNAWTNNPNFWDEGILHITMAMLIGFE